MSILPTPWPGWSWRLRSRCDAIAAPAGYFPLMGISFVRGRDFDAAERGQRGQRSEINDGAIVIGSGLARRLWGGADAIGRRLVSVGPNLRGTRTFTIVGVVDDATTGERDRERRSPLSRASVTSCESTSRACT